MNVKKINRMRRAKRSRLKISLIVHKTPKHMYAQIISADGSRVLVDASTLQLGIKTDLKYTGNIEAAAKVGRLIAQKAKELGLCDVVFDRSGFRYHGRVKALADAAREIGLNF